MLRCPQDCSEVWFWTLTWTLSGDGVGLDLLQEGTHTGLVLQVSGQCSILYFKEGLWG